jgi:hypothetical protein
VDVQILAEETSSAVEANLEEEEMISVVGEMNSEEAEEIEILEVVVVAVAMEEAEEMISVVEVVTILIEVKWEEEVHLEVNIMTTDFNNVEVVVEVVMSPELTKHLTNGEWAVVK